ncbi:hypothetical protein K7472_20575 [Streptomyces sp. PTM05]|uniref:Uncharacterized protein n=1 Tax=Streptantibioticus parmotrematis TaxID=2873249 RepID=A0ABS7QX17_9ACTN|nr:hypothetical protein [Streptantibioticus parmotrematis]MBY8887224.1 hypothetical protein [Streptantibioticus parmotrematis]
MTEKSKPPTRRRPAGRVLGATKASVPPPSAELTREQLEAEEPKRQAADPAPPTSVKGEALTQAEVHDSVDGPAVGPDTSHRQGEDGRQANLASAEVAVSAAPQPFPVGGTPTSTDRPLPAPDPSPDEGTATWVPGPGRPENIPSLREVLNQRVITRESLDASVASQLRLKKRIKRFALDNDVDHLPMGDIVSVAIDEWLSTRGY